METVRLGDNRGNPTNLERLAGAKIACTVPHSERGSDGPPECCYGEPVYLFPESVRVPCMGMKPQWPCFVRFPELYDRRRDRGAGLGCPCHGLGWTASEDGWWQAARKAGFWISLYHDEKGDSLVCHIWWGKDNHIWGKSEDGDPNPLLSTALTQAVEQMGAEL